MWRIDSIILNEDNTFMGNWLKAVEYNLVLKTIIIGYNNIVNRNVSIFTSDPFKKNILFSSILYKLHLKLKVHILYIIYDLLNLIFICLTLLMTYYLIFLYPLVNEIDCFLQFFISSTWNWNYIFPKVFPTIWI